MPELGKSFPARSHSRRTASSAAPAGPLAPPVLRALSGFRPSGFHWQEI